MSEKLGYSAKVVYDGLSKTFHQYLRAQYHIWDESLIKERDRLFDVPGTTHQEPHIEATPIYLGGDAYQNLAVPLPVKEILQLAASAFPSTGIPQTPYYHQALAIETFFKGNSDLIVATGTGSGKTESFLMPVLGALAEESRSRPLSWRQPAIRALLLYPMNALVNDQVSRLRRLLGNASVAASLRANGGRTATFGMYTSRTPYPGKTDNTKNKRYIRDVLSRLYIDGVTPEIRGLLQEEGKWPAKDVASFIANDYTTGPDDIELLTRQEMQARSPDVLVTNYSMLEYMMLRPIEATIFSQTSKWLTQSEDNQLIVVLDEAHMYRGSGGAEVAYLLRRLHSRLGVSRRQVRYILTSASLGSGEDSQKQIIEFAKKLTGSGEGGEFAHISGKRQAREEGSPASSSEREALSDFKFDVLHSAHENLAPAKEQLSRLAEGLGVSVEAPPDFHALQGLAFRILQSLPVASLVAEAITASPRAMSDLIGIAFPAAPDASNAIESLLALMAFAKDENNRPFASIRSHLFYRGLRGLYVCTNATCGRVNEAKDLPLGRMRSSSAFQCDCGSRVYELLTHRDCGAAYLRGFVTSEDGDFLWHEPSQSTWADRELIEAQLYVATRGENAAHYGYARWLHTPTGRLLKSAPSSQVEGEYLQLIMPTKRILDKGRLVLTIEPECPSCKKEVSTDPKIMDLATKGEAPFAHLVRTQVALQPAVRIPSYRSPNGGRKALLFSDGRQKAARLARDIPREIELDVFRQMLILAATQLSEIGSETLLNKRMYASFLKAISDNGLLLFDGKHRDTLSAHVKEFETIYGGNLDEALEAFDPPSAYVSLLLKQLCSTFYSVSALTLAYVIPSKIAMRSLRLALPQLGEEEIRALAVPWIHRVLARFAFDRAVLPSVRRQAWPYPANGIQHRDGYTSRQREYLSEKGLDVEKLTGALAEAICDPVTDGGLYIFPQKVNLRVATNDRWIQCENCKGLLPGQWWGRCTNCLSTRIAEMSPGETSYLRARKGFWRDPVVAVIDRAERPVNLTVEEHTAQLSHKDRESTSTTTEEFERRFKDILVEPKDISIDVLSCTTTMEVGIDIGSLVAVGMRNVPPMRQNYQQRAGRAGRRGSSISTVVTYAQNGAHDAYYFANPEKIIGGDPPRPILDTDNTHIIKRHIHAQLVQDFFGPRTYVKDSGDIYSALGDTWSFYTADGPTGLSAFKQWVEGNSEAKASLDRASAWLPSMCALDPRKVAEAFVSSLERLRPPQEDGLEKGLIDFMFAKGLLPSYAFPRDLCALQIERMKSSPRTLVSIEEKPQQSLSIALSEYAPGKQVVVNKKTYRVGTIAADLPSTEVDRGEPLFSRSKQYVHCSKCLYTAGFADQRPEDLSCPQCRSATLSCVTVITPEVAFPAGKKEVDEYDDEQTFSRATAAQLPLPDATKPLKAKAFGVNGLVAFERSQSLVMVNPGALNADGTDGFDVCERCGKVLLDGEPHGAHERDYWVQPVRGRPGQPPKCTGTFQRVYLGYSFVSDALVLRFKLQSPLRFDFVQARKRRPMEDALTSLSDALVLAMGRVLDIDVREVSAGFRFASQGGEAFADVYVYDTLSGGAGYAYLAGEMFERIFDEAERLLDSCSCDSSCEECLRHYGNRFNHANLDRRLALAIARYIRAGQVNETLSKEEQVIALSPFSKLLVLAGWAVTDNHDGSFSAHMGKNSIQVNACPSLVDCSPQTIRGPQRHFVFTPYELQRDLASAYAEVV